MSKFFSLAAKTAAAVLASWVVAALVAGACSALGCQDYAANGVAVVVGMVAFGAVLGR